MDNELHRNPATPEEIWAILRSVSEKQDLIPGTQYLIHGILDGRGERKGPSETNGNQVSCPQNPVSTEFHK